MPGWKLGRKYRSLQTIGKRACAIVPYVGTECTFNRRAESKRRREMIASACSSALTTEPHQAIPTAQIVLEAFPGSLSHHITNLRTIGIGNCGNDVWVVNRETTKHGPDEGIIVESSR